MTSLDLKDAHWHIPIAKSHQKYLAFSIVQGNFCFKAMPFGLSIAPRVFTKICAVIVQELRSKGVLVFAYLDDWLIIAKSRQEAVQATVKVQKSLERAGFLINHSKSSLISSQKIIWLGWE